MNPDRVCALFLLFLFIFVTEKVPRRGRERGRETIPSRLYAVIEDPDTDL